MSYLNHLLKEINLAACELMRELRRNLELSVKPCVVPRIGHKLIKLLDKQLQICIKANYLIVNNRHVKRLQISDHKTKMQNSS